MARNLTGKECALVRCRSRAVQWSTEELEEDHPRVAAGRPDGLAQPWGSQNSLWIMATQPNTAAAAGLDRTRAGPGTYRAAGRGWSPSRAGRGGRRWTCRLEGHVLAAGISWPPVGWPRRACQGRTARCRRTEVPEQTIKE